MSYPKNTAICIEHLFPDATPLDDFSVLTNSDGTNIFKWNEEKLGAKPSIKKITEISNEAEKTRKFKNIRKKRNQLLAETDWQIVRGLESGQDLSKLKDYRQKLRDLPSTNDNPDLIIFPTR
jgi:hypothetical protein